MTADAPGTSESSDLNAYMARRSRRTAIVVFEPRADGSASGSPAGA